MVRFASILWSVFVLALGTQPSSAEFAIAFDQNGPKDWWLGWSKDQPDQAAAEKEAMAKCMSGSGLSRSCSVVKRGANNCFAFALSDTAPVRWGTGVSPDQKAAERLALNDCKSKGQSCSIKISECDGTPPLTPQEIAAFRGEVVKCFSPQVSSIPRAISVDIMVAFNADGSVKGIPTISKHPPGSPNQQLTEIAVRAIMQCSPYKSLPAAKYRHWSTMEMTFTPGSMDQ